MWEQFSPQCHLLSIRFSRNRKQSYPVKDCCITVAGHTGWNWTWTRSIPEVWDYAHIEAPSQSRELEREHDTKYGKLNICTLTTKPETKLNCTMFYRNMSFSTYIKYRTNTTQIRHLLYLAYRSSWHWSPPPLNHLQFSSLSASEFLISRNRTYDTSILKGRVNEGNAPRF